MLDGSTIQVWLPARDEQPYLTFQIGCVTQRAGKKGNRPFPSRLGAHPGVCSHSIANRGIETGNRRKTYGMNSNIQCRASFGPGKGYSPRETEETHGGTTK